MAQIILEDQPMKEQIEKQAIEEMQKDLIEIFDEEYEKRRLITPKNTAEKMTAKGYRKQSEGEWIIQGLANPKCSICNRYTRGDSSTFCPNCGAKMKGGSE
jgi:rubrerythrin